jgi:hypothetical protein
VSVPEGEEGRSVFASVTALSEYVEARRAVE